MPRCRRRAQCHIEFERRSRRINNSPAPMLRCVSLNEGLAERARQKDRQCHGRPAWVDTSHTVELQRPRRGANNWCLTRSFSASRFLVLVLLIGVQIDNGLGALILSGATRPTVDRGLGHVSILASRRSLPDGGTRWASTVVRNEIAAYRRPTHSGPCPTLVGRSHDPGIVECSGLDEHRFGVGRRGCKNGGTANAAEMPGQFLTAVRPHSEMCRRARDREAASLEAHGNSEGASCCPAAVATMAVVRGANFARVAIANSATKTATGNLLPRRFRVGLHDALLLMPRPTTRQGHLFDLAHRRERREFARAGAPSACLQSLCCSSRHRCRACVLR